MKVSPFYIGLAVLLIGVVIIIFSISLAFNAYETYKPILPQAKSLDEAITNTAYELVNLVLKLGFLGIIVWGGGLLLRHGIGMLIESYRIDRGTRECSGQQS
ncbi:MAG: hypothetical protein ABWW65_05835 [Thermoprotei archaeon]